MRQAVQVSVEQLKQAVEAIVGQSPLRDRLLGVDIDPNDDPDQPFVRVNLKLRGADKMPASELISLQVSIEDGLSTVDERFASVRFAEAA